MAVSIKDIAERAGVSPSTVSRALNDHPRISRRTRERIRRLAKEMGYSPSAIARSLVAKRTFTIGLVISFISDPFLAQVVRGVEEAAIDNGYSVFLCSSYGDPTREMAVVETFRERRADGIIVTTSRVDSLYAPLLDKFKIPIVLINCREYAYSVSTDNLHGGQLATEHLLELGHTRIGYISSEEGGRTNLDRLEGYKMALRRYGIAFDQSLVSAGDGKVEGGKEGMKRLLALPCPPTAVFCYNDMTAIGAAAALREAGLRVPEDMSLVGFDDIDLAPYLNPPLTTVRQPRYELGRSAMEMLLALLAGEAVTNVLLQGELIVRESSRPPSYLRWMDSDKGGDKGDK